LTFENSPFLLFGLLLPVVPLFSLPTQIPTTSQSVNPPLAHSFLNCGLLSQPDPFHLYGVIVVGGCNAGLVAALSAREAGAHVALLECAPKVERGGNSRFAGAIFRVVHNSRSDIEPLLYPSD
jgi:hypothetical protein